MRARLRNAACRIAGLEAGIVALAAPFLLFPGFQPMCTVGALAALLLVWLLRWLGTGRPGARTLLDAPLLLLALMVPIAVWASALPELALPKLTGFILGLAAFRTTVNAGSSPRGRPGATAVLLALGLGIAVVGLAGVEWPEKLPLLGPLQVHIPRLIHGLPGAEVGINANELGGAMALFLPVSLVICRAWGTGHRWSDWVVRSATRLGTLFIGTVLVVTQSRSAWIGALLGLGTMAWIRWRRARWLMSGVAIVLAFGLWYIGPQAVWQALLAAANPARAGPMLGAVSFEGRVEIWNRALETIQASPLTGCGLGSFRQVARMFSPLFLLNPEMDVGHAHNLFLQVALDLGLPGLIAYLALVGTALWICLRAVRRDGVRDNIENSQRHWLALGIVGSLVALHAYGLTDAIALGAKPGVAFWILLGLAAGLEETERAALLRPAETVVAGEFSALEIV